MKMKNLTTRKNKAMPDTLSGGVFDGTCARQMTQQGARMHWPLISMVLFLTFCMTLTGWAQNDEDSGKFNTHMGINGDPDGELLIINRDYSNHNVGVSFLYNLNGDSDNNVNYRNHTFWYNSEDDQLEFRFNNLNYLEYDIGKNVGRPFIGFKYDRLSDRNRSRLMLMNGDTYPNKEINGELILDDKNDRFSFENYRGGGYNFYNDGEYLQGTVGNTSNLLLAIRASLITAKTALKVEQGITAIGVITAESNVTVAGTLTANNTITANGTITANDALTVSDQITANGGLYTNDKIGIGIDIDQAEASLHIKRDINTSKAQLLIEAYQPNAQDARVIIRGHRDESTSDKQAQLLFQNYDNNSGSIVRNLGMITGEVNDSSTNIGNMAFYSYADGLTATKAMEITSDNKILVHGELFAEGKFEIDEVNARKVKVNPSMTVGGWPDYVFTKSYSLAPLSEVAAFIDKNNHLPEVPSAAEVAENGYSVTDMDAILLKKIEELTLHMIRLEQENERLKSLIEN